MKQEINQIIEDYPRHYVRMIAKQKNLVDWIKENSLVDEHCNFAEQIYSALHAVSNQCIYGSTKKFTGYVSGYKGCGTAKTCKCVSDQVSNSVKQTVSNFSKEKRLQINDKRDQTTMEKYGVTNNGQTSLAKIKHQDFYSDQTLVANSVTKNKQTKFKRYGNEHYNNPEKIKKTWKEMAPSFWKDHYDDKKLDILNDKDKLTSLFNSKTIYDISQLLGVHIQTVYRYLNKHEIRSPYQSSYEQEIVLFLRELGITNIVQNTRTLLPSRKEIDIYLPDYNIAIEFNGIYWHHEDIDHITRSYHYQKFYEAEQLGIQLITIFSNFWNSKKDIVKATLKNKLGLNSNSIYARNTTVCKLLSRETKMFLEANHVQGYTPGSFCYGLRDKNEQLAAVMTFSKARVAIGSPSNGYELVRYASDKRVVGGAGKLLKAFRNDFPNTEVFSYSNNEWSNGNLYAALGFKLEKEIPVSYWYIHPKEEKLMHRFNFAKQKLVEKGYDKNLTEKEITKQIGLLKIWDCGKRKWVLR